jgi:3-phenylpropionate/trans-cinnamate dioxygenase ferredoxin component
MTSADFIRICSTEDVPKGTAVRAVTGDLEIAVVHGEDDAFYAVYDECSHAAVALSEGEIDGCTIECWLHGSRFDLRTGEPTGLPATEPVPVYPVEIRDGDVFVGATPSNGVTPA